MTEPPRAFGEPPLAGRIRVEPEDFRVREEMAVEPEGTGEHLWLHLRKRGWNTGGLAEWLARRAGVAPARVGFSGRKDRRAVTEQWFSIQLPGREDPVFDWPEGVELLDARRHGRKLRPGTHRANHFVIRVREPEGDARALDERLDRLARQGVPNYFGAQRFGAGGANFRRGRDWLLGTGEAPRKRALRGLWLSAVRSELFNRVLAERVRWDCWHWPLEGEIMQPEASRGLFPAAEDPRSAERAHAGQVHPTAPLPGAGGMASSGACAALEDRVLAPQRDLVAALARVGVEGARRATRLLPRHLERTYGPQGLELRFTLPPGAFATAVLAELVVLREQPGPEQQGPPHHGRGEQYSGE